MAPIGLQIGLLVGHWYNVCYCCMLLLHSFEALKHFAVLWTNLKCEVGLPYGLTITFIRPYDVDNVTAHKAIKLKQLQAARIVLHCLLYRLDDIVATQVLIG